MYLTSWFSLGPLEKETLNIPSLRAASFCQRKENGYMIGSNMDSTNIC